MVTRITASGNAVTAAFAGDHVELALGGIEDGALRAGYILTLPIHPVPPVTKFKAEIQTFSSLDVPLVPGHQLMLHSHALEEACDVTHLLRTLDREGHTGARKPRCILKETRAVVRVRLARPAALETFEAHPRLGRFILRYGSKTIGAGKILKIKQMR